MSLPHPVLHSLTDAQENFDALARQAPIEATALPSTPFDGQVIYFVADATNGVVWQLRYNASSTSAYKWEFVGGQPLQAQATAQVTLPTLASFTDFSDASPTIALPLSGDYDLEYGGHLAHSGNGQGILLQPVATGLAAGTVAAYLFFVQATTTNGTAVTAFTRYRAAGLSGTLKMQYFVGATGGTAERRKLFATPVRVG